MDVKPLIGATVKITKSHWYKSCREAKRLLKHEDLAVVIGRPTKYDYKQVLETYARLGSVNDTAKALNAPWRTIYWIIHEKGAGLIADRRKH
jgi:hypothetical protein